MQANLRLWKCVVAVTGLLLVAVEVHASPIVESQDRMEINWGTMRIRFYGESKGGSDNYRAAEKTAWSEGLTYASEAVRNLNIAANEAAVSDPNKLADDAKAAASHIATSTYSYNTTYYGDGTVRVYLESLLPKALTSSALRFRQKETASPAMSEFTGIVFRTSKDIKPRATYKVVDEAGNVLFDVSDMAEDAFRKNLMGRWFQKPVASELRPAVGRNPLFIDAEAQADGRLVVKKSAWDEAISGRKALLVAGNIALALP